MRFKVVRRNKNVFRVRTPITGNHWRSPNAPADKMLSVVISMKDVELLRQAFEDYREQLLVLPEDQNDEASFHPNRGVKVSYHAYLIVFMQLHLLFACSVQDQLR
jgi:hypothetical protein